MTKKHLLPIVPLLATVLAASIPLQPRDLADGAIAQSTVNTVHGGCTSYLYYTESTENNKSCYAASIECSWIDTWTTGYFVVGNGNYAWSSENGDYKVSTNAATTSNQVRDMRARNDWTCKDGLGAFGGQLGINTYIDH